jgi:energy-coupling factor transporter ATP-binding protein EcfA2
MFESVISLLGDVATKLVTKLFVSATADKVVSALNSMRIQNAKGRTTLRILESLAPFITSELSELEARLLAQELSNRLERWQPSTQLLATHKFNVESVVSSLIDESKRTLIQPDLPSHILKILDDMTYQAVLVTIALANLLPEWERISWHENFRELEKIQLKLDQQSDLLARMLVHDTNKSTAFEQAYKKYIANDLKRVQVKGLGTVGDVKTLSLESMFVETSVRKLPEESDLRPPRGQAHTAPESTPTLTRKPTPEILDISAALNRSSRVVLLGAPGSGKSTLAQMVALRVLSPVEGSTERIPFLLRVRSFANFDQLPTPKDLVRLCAPLLDLPEATAFTSDILNSGRATLVIDGLDECEIGQLQAVGTSTHVRETEREKVLTWIDQFANTFPGTQILATSRPAGYKRGELRSSGFTEYELIPISKDQQGRFVERWCHAVELSVSPEDPAAALARASSAAEMVQRSVSRSHSVGALAYNPLMLSVICILHRYEGGKIQERKVRKIDLLHDCIHVLLYDWRNAHGLRQSVIGDLNARELRGLLEPLAWQMTLDGKEEVPEELLVRVFAEHLPELRQPATRASQIIGVIRDRTGVLSEVSPGTYSFMHLQFQEYLAAEECAQGKENYDLLIANVDNPRWKEVIPMAIAASKSNQETLLRVLLQKQAVCLAASALSMMDRASPQIRREVGDSIRALGESLITNYSSDAVKSLVDLASIEAAAAAMRLICGIPTLSPFEYHDFVKSWDFGDKGPTRILELAQNTVERALRWHELDIGDGWGITRGIGYYSDVDGLGRGASWSVHSLGLREPLDAPLGSTSLSAGLALPAAHIGLDPAYNYAVMLDVCNGQRGALEVVCWEAFEEVQTDFENAPEKKLLALHLAWYVADANTHVDDLFDFLDQFPRSVYPAFQIGILNNAMSRVDLDVFLAKKFRAEGIWRQAFAEVIEQIQTLFPAWINDLYVGETPNDIPTDVNDAVNNFRKVVTSSLNGKEPFTCLRN